MIPFTSTTISTASQPRNSPYLFSASPSTEPSDLPPRAEPTSTSSSIRPRNRRLLSTENELVSTTSGTSTPAGSRDASPIPRKHPSRSVRGRQGNGTPVGGLLVPVREGEGARTGRGGSSPSPVGIAVGSGRGMAGGGGGWWDGGWTSSWSALQGLASSVLSGDMLGDGGEAGNVKNGTEKRSKKTKPSRELPATWGPEGLPKFKDQRIGAGSTTEREAKLKTRKMAGVLEGREADESRMLDTNGNYKRRTSLEEARQGFHDDGGDALVYIHHVQPQDTLAGVVLKYNCQPAVFRKANRFWPNDSIQTRKVVILPVDACAIKGRPCEAPTADRPGVDLLAPTPAAEDPPPFQNGTSWPPGASSQKETSAERPESEEEHPWVHVRWVSLDSSPNSRPVEIARMPRKTLGYFPPRRRKSQNTTSTVSTPRGSLDFPQVSRSPSQELSGSPITASSRRTSNLSARPAITSAAGSYFPGPPSHTSSSARSRRESVGEAAERIGWMRRPGGVGTFGKNVRMPGPANDGLNAWAKKHIPGLAIDGMPSTSVLAAESARLGFGEELGRIAEGPTLGNGTGMLTPTGVGNVGLGLENAAAAIEGWVRRLAIKPGTPKLGGRSIMVSADGADLIELLDGAGSDDGRGFELNPGSFRSGNPLGGSGGASGREDFDALARGRPVAGAKSGKSD